MITSDNIIIMIKKIVLKFTKMFFVHRFFKNKLFLR